MKWVIELLIRLLQRLQQYTDTCLDTHLGLLEPLLDDTLSLVQVQRTLTIDLICQTIEKHVDNLIDKKSGEIDKGELLLMAETITNGHISEDAKLDDILIADVDMLYKVYKVIKI